MSAINSKILSIDIQDSINMCDHAIEEILVKRTRRTAQASDKIILQALMVSRQHLEHYRGKVMTSPPACQVIPFRRRPLVQEAHQ